ECRSNTSEVRELFLPSLMELIRSDGQAKALYVTAKKSSDTIRQCSPDRELLGGRSFLIWRSIHYLTRNRDAIVTDVDARACVSPRTGDEFFNLRAILAAE